MLTHRQLTCVGTIGENSMQVASVIGTAVSTIKHQSMVGSKMLVVQPYLTDGKTPDGFPLLALDTVGAGKGDTVIITSAGKLCVKHFRQTRLRLGGLWQVLRTNAQSRST